MTGTSLLSNQIRPSFGRLVTVGAVLAALALAVLAGFERQRLVGEFNSKSAILHRLASQRADQHDAHLTSLSAIFVAGGIARQDLLLDVAATIMRFYPRITSVTVIPFDQAEAAIETLPGLSEDDTVLVRQLAQQTTGTLQIAQMLSAPDHYLLVKRSPNTDAGQHGLALAIDAQALIATDDPFWQMPSVAYGLLTPDGAALTGEIIAGGAAFSKPLGSASQPLILKTSLEIHLADLLPLGKALSILTVVSGLFVIAVLGLAQRARTNDAEKRASLSAHETRLAHASRVNVMGEMASGMAHELAQPLTAILSQAQAGRHLARRGDVDRLRQVLDDTISQAQRASDILNRLRNWSKPNRTPSTACSLNDAVNSVERLLASETNAAGAMVTLALSDPPVFIDADPVELEQVIFNLVRNALDASDAAQVTVRTIIVGETAILEVADDGPGVPADLQPRIFEPFVTNKIDGTGLGLALCQRLVEEMGGEIAFISDASETTFRLSLPISKMQGAS